MKKIAVLAGIFIMFALFTAFYVNSLAFKIKKVVKNKDCTVSAALIKDNKIWSFNDRKTPLMSVFKYFVAVCVLKQLENGGIPLHTKITVNEDMLDKNTYSPMLKKYKNFPFEISIAELIKYMISESDNNATDILIEYIGGTKAVRSYLYSCDFDAVEIFANEREMNLNTGAQYLNKARAFDVLLAIKTFRETNFLTDEHKKFLDKAMIEAVTGKDKIKAGLPAGTIFGHKTGSSSRKTDGVKIADNDTGFVILPDGSTYYIAVFVAESKLNDKENAALIAQISNVIYNHLANNCQKLFCGFCRKNRHFSALNNFSR